MRHGWINRMGTRYTYKGSALADSLFRTFLPLGPSNTAYDLSRTRIKSRAYQLRNLKGSSLQKQRGVDLAFNG